MLEQYTTYEKYVTYKGTKYKVLWYRKNDEDYLAIYKGKQSAWDINLYFDYTEEYSIPEKTVKSHILTSINDPNYYIEEIKMLFHLYQEDLDKNKKEKLKIKTLEEWDGIIK